MVARKKTSAPAREPGLLPRKHHMQTDMTPAEKRSVMAHCEKLGISVSQYLAELAVADAKASLKQRQEAEEKITLTLRLPRDKRTKLAIFAQRRGLTMEDHASELLIPRLEKLKTFFPVKTETLRYYLDSAEHSLVKKQFKKRGLSSRSYVSYLALQEMKNHPKKKR